VISFIKSQHQRQKTVGLHPRGWLTVDDYALSRIVNVMIKAKKGGDAMNKHSVVG